MIKIYISQASPWLRLLSKIIIQMKIALFIVFITCLNVSAKVFSQEKLSLDLKNVKLEKALQIIEKQSRYRFVYSPTEGPFSKLISIKVHQSAFEEVMDKLLLGTSLNFKVDANNLVSILSANDFSKEIIVTGIVRDTAGSALPGVTVSVKGMKGVGTSTDGGGKFILKVPDNAVLVFSLVGFETVEMLGGATLSVVLQVTNNKLDDIVVIGYGTSTKRKLNSTVNTLDMTNVAPLPVQSINDAIAGRIAGTIVTSNTGIPGAKSQISIRGGATPLFVIDNQVRTQADFENLNPNDIDSYSVLMDVGATALYGQQGANGIILVTTKKGAEGKTNITYSYNSIYAQPTLLAKPMSSYDTKKAQNDVFIAEGRIPPTSDAILELYRNQSQPYLYGNTDWFKLALKDIVPEYRHDLSVSSGTKQLTYYASASYYDQGSILRTDKEYDNKRVTYRLNTESNFEKINLKVLVGIDGYVELNNSPITPYGSIFDHVQRSKPDLPSGNEFGLPLFGDPRADFSAGYNRGNTRVLNSILTLDYKAHFLKGLGFKATGSYNMGNYYQKVWGESGAYYNLGSQTPLFPSAPYLNVNTSTNRTWNIQGFVAYSRIFGNHSIDFTGVAEQSQYIQSTLGATRTNYQISFDQFVAGPTLNQSLGGGEVIRNRAGYVGRLSYNYLSKYFLDGTVRRDGNDYFPRGKQWGNFYSASAGYILSEEKFMQKLKDKHIIDYLKLRASIGQVGNLPPRSNDNDLIKLYIPGYNVNTDAYIINDIAVQGTSEPNMLPSNNYTWFTDSERNFGLDINSLNNRLSATIGYFYKRTTGFLTSDPRYAATLGIGLPQINFTDAATRREGTEFKISWGDKINEFNYKLGVNLTYFNTLVERSATENDVALKNPYTRISGTTSNPLQQGYNSLGFYENNADLLTGARRIASINTVAGDLKYADVNGDGKIDAADFRPIGNNSMPRMNYGFTFDLGYKGFFFSGVVMGSGNRDRYVGILLQGGNPNAFLAYDIQRDYWRPDNREALFPRQVSSNGVNGNNNYSASDFWVIKSRFLRLKYLQAGYDFKKILLKKFPLQQCRLFFSGTNLLTSSKSQKYFIDPESDPGYTGYPIQRTFALGLNVGF